MIYGEGCNDQPKTTDHDKNDRRRIFVTATQPGQQGKIVRDSWRGLYTLLSYLGPDADVIGLVGQCKLLKDVANETTSMICLSLAHMLFLCPMTSIMGGAMSFIPMNCVT